VAVGTEHLPSLSLAEPDADPEPAEAPPVTPRWTESAVAIGSLLLNSWALSRNGSSNGFYTAAATSMSQDLRSFVYASSDVGTFITPDKPPLARWIQAISIKVFGYSPWSALLPSAIAGALSVWLLIVMVRRVWGRPAGLAAGVVLALTPMAVAVSRSSNPDAIFVLMLVLAAFATERLVATDQRRWAAAAGVLSGLAFVTKMLAVGVIIPAIGVAALVGLRVAARRVIAHLVLIGALFLVAGGSWIALIDLSPNAPFVGGSVDGSAWRLVFGYNGLGRVFGGEANFGGGPPGGFGGGGAPPIGAVGGIDEFGGQAGFGRLFNAGMGDQAMWLSVLAAVVIIAGTLSALRRRERDARAASIALFSLWLVAGFLLFGLSDRIVHNYYVSAIAPPMAALVGIGVGAVVGGSRSTRLLAAAAMAGTAVVELIFVRRVDAFEWLRVVSPVAIGVCVVGLAVWAWRPALASRRSTALVVGGLAAVLLAPAMWIASGVTRAQSGPFPDARPSTGAARFLADPGGAGFGGVTIGKEVLDHLTSMTTTETWVLAVQNTMGATEGILDGYPLLPMGGFIGNDPAMTPERLAELVDRGKLRFVSPGGGSFGGFGGISAVSTWVSVACPTLDVSQVAGATSRTVIYDCQRRGAEILAAAASSPTLATPPPLANDPAAPSVPPSRGTIPSSQSTMPGNVPGAPPFGGGGAVPPGFEQVAACFAEHGIAPPDVQGGPLALPDPNDSKFQAAFDDCARYFPSGFPAGPGAVPGGPPPG
jgi:4-amino-4-deoxy-L-arabinose transferase-like glycosyltransferase